MESWVGIFVVVACAAIVLQMAILLGMYLQMRDMNRRITRIASDLQMKVEPILTRANRILEDSQRGITSIVSDAAEITHLARHQAQKVDRVFTDAVDRLRGQIVHADQILSGTLESIEDAGIRVRKTLIGPVQQVSALLKGLKVGLDFIRGSRRGSESSAARQDEELFI